MSLVRIACGLTSPRPDKLLELKEVHSMLGRLCKSGAIDSDDKAILQQWYLSDEGQLSGIPVSVLVKAKRKAMAARHLLTEYQNAAGSYGNLNGVF